VGRGGMIVPPLRGLLGCAFFSPAGGKNEKKSPKIFNFQFSIFSLIFVKTYFSPKYDLLWYAI